MTDVAPASPDVTPGTALAKAALYLRVSTGRQAESDLSIPSASALQGIDMSRELVEGLIAELDGPKSDRHRDAPWLDAADAM